MWLKIQYDDSAEDIMRAVNLALADHGLSFKDDGKEHDGYVAYELVDNRKPVLVGHHLSNSKMTSLARFDHRLSNLEVALIIGQSHPFFPDKKCMRVEQVGGDEWTYKLYFE